METILLLAVGAGIAWTCWRWFLRDWVNGLSSTRQLKARLLARQIPDEAYYEMAALELEKGTVRKGLWVQALAESGGQEAAAKARYLQLRVQAMREEAAAAFSRANTVHRDGATDDDPPDHAPDRVVLNCPSCEGKLRVPSGRLLDVSCPRCGKTFRLQT